MRNNNQKKKEFLTNKTTVNVHKFPYSSLLISYLRRRLYSREQWNSFYVYTIRLRSKWPSRGRITWVLSIISNIIQKKNTTTLCSTGTCRQIKETDKQNEKTKEKKVDNNNNNQKKNRCKCARSSSKS